jgi:hypothetical protein
LNHRLKESLIEFKHQSEQCMTNKMKDSQSTSTFSLFRMNTLTSYVFLRSDSPCLICMFVLAKTSLMYFRLGKTTSKIHRIRKLQITAPTIRVYARTHSLCLSPHITLKGCDYPTLYAEVFRDSSLPLSD